MTGKLNRREYEHASTNCPYGDFGAMNQSQRQRFTTQKTRLKSTLSSKHVITGK